MIGTSRRMSIKNLELIEEEKEEESDIESSESIDDNDIVKDKI